MKKTPTTNKPKKTQKRMNGGIIDSIIVIR